jgi:hypothetical protein
VDTFQVWDTAGADSYLMTGEDLVSASETAAGLGDWDMILPQV